MDKKDKEIIFSEIDRNISKLQSYKNRQTSFFTRANIDEKIDAYKRMKLYIESLEEENKEDVVEVVRALKNYRQIDVNWFHNSNEFIAEQLEQRFIGKPDLTISLSDASADESSDVGDNEKSYDSVMKSFKRELEYWFGQVLCHYENIGCDEDRMTECTHIYLNRAAKMLIDKAQSVVKCWDPNKVTSFEQALADSVDGEEFNRTEDCQKWAKMMKKVLLDEAQKELVKRMVVKVTFPEKDEDE